MGGSTSSPTPAPTLSPTIYPTINSTINPTIYPTINPTMNPTIYPTMNPTINPTVSPTMNPIPSSSDWCFKENSLIDTDFEDYLGKLDDVVNITTCLNICDGIVEFNWGYNENYTMCNYVKYEIEQFSNECRFYKDIDSIYTSIFYSEYIIAHKNNDPKLGNCITTSNPTRRPTFRPTRRPTTKPTDKTVIIDNDSSTINVLEWIIIGICISIVLCIIGCLYCCYCKPMALQVANQ